MNSASSPSQFDPIHRLAPFANTRMKLQTKDFIVIAVSLALVASAFFTWGWAGVVLAVGVGLMWALLHFTRLMHTLRRATKRPKGWVSSAVMLQSRLHLGMPMLKVVQLTGAFGDCLQALDADQQTETWRWTDDGGDAVQAVFQVGKLSSFQLIRKAQAPPGP